MIKYALAATALMAGTPALAEDFPVFEFERISEAQIYPDLALLDAKALACEGGGVSYTCKLNTYFAGSSLLGYIIITDAKLGNLVFKGHSAGLVDAMKELKSRYGTPCETGQDIVTNGFGARIPSFRFTWCFRSGKMSLRERDGHVDYFSIRYVRNPE